MATPPLSESLAKAAKCGDDPSRCGFELSRHIVLGVREAKVNRPDLVHKYGLHLLEQHKSSLSHEVWAMMEQVYVALLQRGRVARRGGSAGPSAAAAAAALSTAQELISTLSTQFPGSLRVKRLEGMMWEAKGETKLASTSYDEILAEDPSNLLALKRHVVLCKSQRNYAEAARKLVEYLSTFCSDPEAWLMLHELYLAQQQFKRASFCIEELVLINPMNYIYHLRAAELLYTMGMSDRGGSHEQLFMARKYFAHALELKPGCLRALYGILLVCAALGASTKSKGTKVNSEELVAFIEPQLIKAYTPASGPAHPMRPLVLAMCKTLGVARAAPPASAGA